MHQVLFKLAEELWKTGSHRGKKSSHLHFVFIAGEDRKLVVGVVSTCVDRRKPNSQSLGETSVWMHHWTGGLKPLALVSSITSGKSLHPFLFPLPLFASVHRLIKNCWNEDNYLFPWLFMLPTRIGLQLYLGFSSAALVQAEIKMV